MRGIFFLNILNLKSTGNFDKVDGFDWPYSTKHSLKIDYLKWRKLFLKENNNF